MEFHPLIPFDENDGQKVLWTALRTCFSGDEGDAFYRYPVYSEQGRMRREPDVLLVHRELGVWVFECKGCRIGNIASIHGLEWRMRDFYREVITPVAQAEDGMFAVKNKIERQREARYILSFRYAVVLPFVSREEWNLAGFGEQCEALILFKEDLKPQRLRQLMIESLGEQSVLSLNDAQWEKVTKILGGAIPRKDSRPIPTGAGPDHPLRVVNAIETALKGLDEQQRSAAWQVPDGPQRLRGLAGTGKTVILAQRAARMHASHPDWKIAVVFFTKALYPHVRDMVERSFRGMTGGSEPDWETLQVLHCWGGRKEPGFYSLAANPNPLKLSDAVEAVGSNAPGPCFDYVCQELLDRSEPIKPVFDAVLIDEGQDLPPSFYQIAWARLKEPKRLYWAYDEAQGIGSLMVPKAADIFGLHPDGSPIVGLRGLYPGGLQKAHNLNRCYRTPRKLLMAGHAVNMGLYREGGPLQGVTNQKDWEELGYKVLEGDFTTASVSEGKPVIIGRPTETSPHIVDLPDFPHPEALGEVLLLEQFDSENEEIEWIASRVAEDIKRGLAPDYILITGPIGNNEFDFQGDMARVLKSHGIPYHLAGHDEENPFREPGHVTISSLFRAKGNEAWKVYCCRFQNATKPLPWKDGEEELHKRNEAFTALTRAKVWCVVTGLRGSPIFEELQKFLVHYPRFKFRAFNQASLRRSHDDTELFEPVEEDQSMPPT